MTRRRDERGAVAVEFALVALPLMMLVFGAVKYGLYFWSLQGGSDAARQAARASAVGDAVSCDELEQRVRQAVELVAPKDTRIAVTRTYTGVDGTAPRSSGAEVQVGDTVSVTLSFDGYDLPLYAPGTHGGRVDVSAVSRVDFRPVAPEPCP